MFSFVRSHLGCLASPPFDDMFLSSCFKCMISKSSFLFRVAFILFRMISSSFLLFHAASVLFRVYDLKIIFSFSCLVGRVFHCGAGGGGGPRGP